MSYNDMKVNALDWFTNLIEENRNLTSLGFANKVKKKFDKVDAIDNISDYVDLGLPSGTLWCSHNYGADNEYECGNLYKHEDATKLDLLPGQLPSLEDFGELKNFCKHKISEVNGVKGMMFISKKNSNEIFFPIAEHYIGIDFVKPYGYYWSSELFQDNAAYNMKFDLSSVIGEGFVNIRNTSYRSYGFLVRTVLKKANESNLGLASKVKKSFVEKSEEDKVNNISHITQETLEELYGDWGHVTVLYQSMKFPTLRTYKEFRLCSNKIGKSYSKFISDMTDGEVECRFSAACWGEENLDAIEFWRKGDRKVLKYQLYGEQKYSVEYVDSFYRNKKNYILDWFIPATLRFLERYPEYIGRFYAKLI